MEDLDRLDGGVLAHAVFGALFPGRAGGWGAPNPSPWAFGPAARPMPPLLAAYVLAGAALLGVVAGMVRQRR